MKRLGDAALAVVLVAGPAGDPGGGLQIGILEDDEGIGAAQLQHGFLEVPAGG